MNKHADDEDSVAAQIDPAAVFACAFALHRACLDLEERDPTFIISESYNGFDQFMREIMRVGELFETWSTDHVLFDELDEVWPYMLEDRFAGACLTIRTPDSLSCFDQTDCYSVALDLKLPLHGRNGLSIPVDLRRQNPLTNSRFEFYQIRSVREHLLTKDVHQFGLRDDPADKNYGKIFYGLYGLDRDGKAEHIADRKTFSEARHLARALVPGIDFPEFPRFLPPNGAKQKSGTAENR